jgi:Tfp pilus assembly protein PilF
MIPRAWDRKRRAGVSVAILLAATCVLAGCGGGAPTPRAELEAPATASFLVASAETALATGDPETARRLLARALREAPESAGVHVAYGRYWTALRRYKDAKDSFGRAAALDPLSPEPAYWLGRAYEQAGDQTEAASAYTAALRLDPNHAAAAAALGPLLGARYLAAGIPSEYALLRGRTTVTRGELAVALAVELGADPDRVSWRSDDPRASADSEELRNAWGARWATAAVAREWIEAFPDGHYHLDDPITRAALALTLARVERVWTAGGGASSPAPSGLSVPAAPDSMPGAHAYSDLGPRHYLAAVAARAARDGLPDREDGRFDPWGSASGADMLAALRGLARRLGASPVVSAEPGSPGVVK